MSPPNLLSGIRLIFDPVWFLPGNWPEPDHNFDILNLDFVALESSSKTKFRYSPFLHDLMTPNVLCTFCAWLPSHVSFPSQWEREKSGHEI